MGETTLDWISDLNLPKHFYRERFGAAFLGDSKSLMERMPAESVDLIVTSPPFALRRKKEYGNVDAEIYVEWFRPFGEQFKRILTERGSLVIDIGGTWNVGTPTRSLYQYELLLSLVKMGFHLCQDFYWYNPAKLPSPAEWVNVRRIRVKDAVDSIWWLSKSPFPKAKNAEVLRKYSESMIQLLANGYRPKRRPSGWEISAKFSRDRGGAIPPNLLIIANTESNSWYLRACAKAGIKPNPARFPRRLPEFFVRFLSDEGDLVLDPFAGSNVTGEVAESLKRRWLAFELVAEYLEGSRFRFEKPPESQDGEAARRRGRSQYERRKGGRTSKLSVE